MVAAAVVVAARTGVCDRTLSACSRPCSRSRSRTVAAAVVAGLAAVSWIVADRLAAAHLAVGPVVVAVCGRLARRWTGADRGAVLVVPAAAPWSGTVALVGALLN